MRTTFNLTCFNAAHLKDVGDNDMPPSNILNVLPALAMLEVSMGNCSNLYAASVFNQTCKQTYIQN